jgi:tetratricopeptide (TPR) repeat protein
LQKWVRRHPRLASPITLGAVTALVLAIALVPTLWQTWKALEKRDVVRDEALLKAETDAKSVRASEQHRAEALLKYHAFRDSLASSRAVMESVNAVQVLPKFMKAWTCEESRLQSNAAKCRRSLDLYEVLQRPAWQDQPMVRHLPAIERERLRRDVSELVFVLAQAEQVRAVHLREQAQLHDAVHGAIAMQGTGLEVWGAWQAVVHVPLASALDLNERARQCCTAAAVPRAMLMQQAELLHLLGKDAQAKLVLTVVADAPIRAGTEDAYWTASALAAKGEYRYALPLLSQAVSEAPDHYGAWLLRGLCLTPEEDLAASQNDQADRQKALECFTTCVVMRPNELWGYYNRGMVSYHLNLNSNALADFDRILQKEILDKQPAFGSAYVHRATVCMAIGKYQEAEKALTAAIALEPDIPEFYFLRARIREKLKKPDDVRLDDQHVLDSTPSSAEGWTYRGMVRSAKDPESALADFDRALELAPKDPLTRLPKDPLTLFVKGRLLAQALKRNEEAVKVLDKVLTVKPDYVEARITRGLAYAALGERGQALKDADAVLDSEPTPHRHYQAARIYALTSRRHPADAQYALALLAYALRNGYGVHTYRQEPDFAPFQKMPEFERLGLGLKFLGVPPR